MSRDQDDLVAIRRITKILAGLEPSAARRVLSFVIDHQSHRIQVAENDARRLEATHAAPAARP